MTHPEILYNISKTFRGELQSIWRVKMWPAGKKKSISVYYVIISVYYVKKLSVLNIKYVYIFLMKSFQPSLLFFTFTMENFKHIQK